MINDISKSITQSLLIPTQLILVLSVLSACSESFDENIHSQDNKTGAYDHYDSYYDDPFADEYASSPWQEDLNDQSAVNEFLSQQLGELESGDLTDGSTIVAGPGYAGPSVVLNCSQGALYVAAGAATGTLATIFAASGLAVGGGGAAITAPASVPLYATAGGLIGLGLSSSSWASCILPLARVGMGLLHNGYWSAARGVQAIVFDMSRNASSRSYSQSQSTTNDCRSGGRKCNDMTGRYKNQFCNPLNRRRQDLNVNVHETGICNVDGLSCSEIETIARLAAGCFEGRQAVTQRCFNGRADEGHERATNYAERDLFSCIDLFFETGCNDYSFEDRLFEQAESSFPECL